MREEYRHVHVGPGGPKSQHAKQTPQALCSYCMTAQTSAGGKGIKTCSRLRRGVRTWHVGMSTSVTFATVRAERIWSCPFDVRFITVIPAGYPGRPYDPNRACVTFDASAGSRVCVALASAVSASFMLCTSLEFPNVCRAELSSSIEVWSWATIGAAAEELRAPKSCRVTPTGTGFPCGRPDADLQSA